MPEHNTDRERIEFALKTEQDGHDFYQMDLILHMLNLQGFEDH